MPDFSITIRGGKFIQESAFKDAVERALDPGLKRAGDALVRSGQGATPVRTGRLKGSWNASRPEWNGRVRRIKVQPNTPYANIVNVRGRSAGYIERGFSAGQNSAESELRHAAGAIVNILWVKG